MWCRSSVSRVCQQENLLFPRNLILPPASRFNARFVIRILFFYTLFVYSLPFCPPFRSLFWYWLYIKSPAHHSPLRLIWVDVTVQPFAHLTYICCRYIDMYECMRVCVFWSRVTINLPLCWQAGIALMTLSGSTRGGWRDKLTWYYITSPSLYMGAVLETTRIFRVKSSNFLCPLSSSRFCLIWSAALVFLADFQNPPCAKYSSLFFHSLSPCVCVCFCASRPNRRTAKGSKWRSELEVRADCVNSDELSCLMTKIKSNKSTREAWRDGGRERRREGRNEIMESEPKRAAETETGR